VTSAGPRGAPARRAAGRYRLPWQMGHRWCSPPFLEGTGTPGCPPLLSPETNIEERVRARKPKERNQVVLTVHDSHCPAKFGKGILLNGLVLKVGHTSIKTASARSVPRGVDKAMTAHCEIWRSLVLLQQQRQYIPRRRSATRRHGRHPWEEDV